MKVGYNGSVVEADEAVIAVYDHGFLYGMGLFETFRTYGGSPFQLGRHLQRLREGSELLGIVGQMAEDDIRAWLAELTAANGLEGSDVYVRLTVTAGVGELGLPAGDYVRPNALLLVKPLPAMDERLYREGKELRLLRTRRNTPETPVRLKSLHYMNNIMAKRELLASGASAGAEGLMLTGDGKLAEGVVSNLFFVRDGIVRTPHTGTGILPGITRALTLELSATLGVPCEEGLYGWGDLLDADEIWLTNSIQELVPVTRLTDTEGAARTVGDGRIGPVTESLLTAYRNLTIEAPR
ncbi:4-amino-4-deoxychorismate lyase [Paenibacillus darwinianus]|uniref:4-amino-4-deoxychorismate lyase n=1 Tax=Paenibacillus darwinianus TaxID=1380763 RepID=A0A9W5S131_9BACL|nr:aminotransferase class IV [Paenibacillus darwinianus]EXX86750.1 4-amino-4-deoxychorismate lyase [Paenibacillus darwinianus]EXX87612.1 4-amino-4-deoxychorismate lyase [Paenibacillus darwinianus]EXX87652.1 4-amino-4-deoxychorismate lyase [Paenibacillus darwinianus]